MSNQPEIDKQQLYGDFRDHEKAKQDLALKTARKALDIADDPVEVQANKTENHFGVGGKALIGTALAAGVPTAALAGLLLMRSPQPIQTPPPAAPTPPAATENAWDAIYEEQQADGSWKQIRRERLKPKSE